MIGRLCQYNLNRGFGWIKPFDGDKDQFVHVSAFEIAGIHPREGLVLEYSTQVSSRTGKPEAINLKVLPERDAQVELAYASRNEVAPETDGEQALAWSIKFPTRA